MTQPTYAAAMAAASQKVAARADKMDLQTGDLHYLVGWLTSTQPAALDDALDAVEACRERSPWVTR